MASQLDSTFDPDAGLRESYLYQLRDEERDVIVPLVATILMLAREGHCIDDGPFPPTFARFRAIAADLRYLEALLRRVSSYEEQASHFLWHAKLMVLGSRIAPRVGELAETLEDELLALAEEATEE